MICAEVRESLAAMLDGELASAAELQAHVAICEACRRELGGLRATRRLLERVLFTQPPIDLVAGFETLRARFGAAESTAAERSADVVAPVAADDRAGAGRFRRDPAIRPAGASR